MKKLLFLLLFPVAFANAQFIEDVFAPYVMPAKLNQKLDSNIYPAPIYYANYYNMNRISNEWEFQGWNKIITKNFLILKDEYTIYNVTSSTKYDKYITEFSYIGDMLIARKYSQHLYKSFTLPMQIDSFKYKNNTIKLTDHWDVDPDTTIRTRNATSIYQYDSLNRFTGVTAGNIDSSINMSYSGYYFVKNFNSDGNPVEVYGYGINYTDYKKDSFIREKTQYFYDNYKRPSLKLYSQNPFHTGSLLLMDSFCFFYSGTSIYPDSVLDYSIFNKTELSAKTIYQFSSNGHLLQTTRYNAYNFEPMLPTAKYVYATISAALINEVNAPTFIIYPNPATTKLKVDVTRNKPEAYKIFDLKGKLITADKFDASYEVNIESFDVGVYFILISNALGSNIRVKFIKE